MNVDSPTTLLYSLLAATALGAVMGYCVALLRAKRRARMVIDDVRRELTRLKSAEADLQSARADLDVLRQSLAESEERAQTTLKREEALDVHAQLQAQRIQTLESQVASYEDQQIRLKRDFASYKSNKSRELELARNKPDSWSGANELPVLQKRINEPAISRNTQASLHSLEAAPDGNEAVTSSYTRKPGSRGLRSPLSRELDIPSLSESELPDSVDELDFELVDLDGTGEWPRG
ncbi:MAG: hypothetical protein HKN42_08245 [Granulosicoccus sp.]|nr:hypothetical protein [Granulosicoccus sp.]